MMYQLGPVKWPGIGYFEVEAQRAQMNPGALTDRQELACTFLGRKYG